MKKELWKLAVQGIRGRKRSSILLLIVLILSFSVAIITLSVTGSMEKTNEEYRFDTYGTWYGAITSGKEEDESFLRESEWADRLGISRSYGVISSAVGSTGIGTIDDTFRDIGRISLQEGSFPQAEDEIAMEASLLSGLGYDYELGQEILLDIGFQAGSEIVYIQKTYKLCGVLKAYTQLWSTPTHVKVLLNGAVVTEEAGEELLALKEEAVENYNAEAAKETEDTEAAEAPVELKADDIASQYYFTVKEGMEQEMEQQVNAYLAETRASSVSVWENDLAYGRQKETSYTYTYAILTFAVTLLAVVCIYTIQMQKQVKQIALFRSIGITKKQLRWMSFFETISISFPAAAAGLLCGSIGVKIILRLLVYAGSAEVYVVIPFSVILPLILFWVIGIFAVRAFVLQIALHQPLTGRLAMSQHKIRRIRIFRKAEILLLSSLFCGTLFLTVMESMTQIYLLRLWKTEACYIIYSWPVAIPPEHTLALPKERLELYRQLPGMDWINGYSDAEVKLDFEGAGDSAFYNAYKAHKQAGISGNSVSLHTIPEEKWNDFFGENEKEFDAEAFRNGEQVYFSFLMNADGDYVLSDQNFGDTDMGGDQIFEDADIETGDEIRLTFTGTIEDDPFSKEKELCSVTAQIGGILCSDGTDIPGTQGMLMESYVVLCSDQFLEKVVSQCEPGYILSGYYRTGEEIGYTTVYGSAGQNAGYLSTDYVLAELCAADGLNLENLREEYAAQARGVQQVLLLLYSSGICIVLVLILIIGNALTLESIMEKRKYGILQAIGMSRRQMKREILKRSLSDSILAVIVGWGLYGCYFLCRIAGGYFGALEQGQIYSFGEYFMEEIKLLFLYIEPEVVPGLAAGAALILLLVWWLAKRSLFRENLMDKLQDRN